MRLFTRSRSRRETTRFVIVCAARTGSTMLRLLLNSHPRICSHGEVYQPPIHGFVGLEPGVPSPLRSWLAKQREADPVRWLHEFVFLDDGEHAVGFKLLYETLFQRQWQRLQHALEVDRQVRVIHLTRKNRLRRLVSRRRADSTGVLLARTDDERARSPKVTLSLEEALADFSAIEREELQVRELFAHHPMLEVTYEDLVDSENSSLDQLQRWLEVEPIELSTLSVRIGSDQLAEQIENYPELLSRAAGTACAAYFD
jgi:LPS sulfotransferase NodH